MEHPLPRPVRCPGHGSTRHCSLAGNDVSNRPTIEVLSLSLAVDAAYCRPNEGVTPSSHLPGGGAMTTATTQALADETRRDLLSTMVLIRTYEEAIRAAYYADKKPAFDIGAGLVPGEMHLSAGQEPVAAGICAHLTAEDAITATHRPHHLAIAHGVELSPMTAEIFGRETGLGHGRGGHMHLFDPSTHFSCSGIIAEGFPPAPGQAFAFQRQGGAHRSE